MITKEQFEELRRNFGKDSSFAIWKSEENVSELSMFDTDDILKKLNDNYIFIALNPAAAFDESGKKDDGKNMKDFENFHSSRSNQKDYKLCHALQETKYWGSYITDFYKQIRETYSDKLKEQLVKSSDQVEKSKELLKEEIRIISKNNPNVVLIALSRETEKQLKKLFNDKYKIVYMTHYSYHYDGCSDKKIYRERVLKELKKQGI